MEQHATEGVNKILIGNKSDWTDKKAVTEEQGRELANELGIKFMETSAKVNEGVEEAFDVVAEINEKYVIPLRGLMVRADRSQQCQDGEMDWRLFLIHDFCKPP